MGNRQHGPAREADQLVRDGAHCDAPTATGAVAADHDEAGADFGRDVVELLPGIAVAQDPGDTAAAALDSCHETVQRLAALLQAAVVELVDSQLADVDHGEQGGELQGQLESLLRGLAEVGSADDVSKRFHGPSMRAACTNGCPITVGSGPPASAPRWIGKRMGAVAPRQPC